MPIVLGLGELTQDDTFPVPSNVSDMCVLRTEPLVMDQ